MPVTVGPDLQHTFRSMASDVRFWVVRPGAGAEAAVQRAQATVEAVARTCTRFDPTSDAALPIADDDLRVVVLCQEGYTSSLAAAALPDVWVHRAADGQGGSAAWRAGGTPGGPTTSGASTPGAANARVWPANPAAEKPR